MANGDINITVIGNLTADPELRYTPNGAAVTNFTVASTPRQYDRQSGEWKDGETVFMRCSIWKEAAENVAETLTRGSRVIATGRLKSRSYEKDGERRTSTELEVDEVGPSLRYATAKVNRTQRNSNAGNGGGWSKDFGQQQANNRDMRGGTTSDDPWATSGASNTSGDSWATNDNFDSPPF